MCIRWKRKWNNQSQTYCGRGQEGLDKCVGFVIIPRDADSLCSVGLDKYFTVGKLSTFYLVCMKVAGRDRTAEAVGIHL